MDFTRLKLMPPEERKANLEGEASSIEEGVYTKQLSEEDLAEYRTILADKSIQQATILDEFKEVKAGYKDKLKPIARDISDALHAVKFKAVNLTGRIYLIPDYETKTMYRVDGEGNLVSSRQMKPEERQYFLSASKAM